MIYSAGIIHKVFKEVPGLVWFGFFCSCLWHLKYHVLILIHLLKVTDTLMVSNYVCAVIHSFVTSSSRRLFYFYNCSSIDIQDEARCHKKCCLHCGL